MVNRTGIGAASSFMIHLLDPHYNRQECLGHALSSGIDGWNGTPEAVLGHVVPGVSKILRVRDRAQEDRFQNQRPVDDFHRESHAAIPVPLFIPDKGAWPRLLPVFVCDPEEDLPWAEVSRTFATKWSVSQITSRIRRTFGRGRWTPKKSRLGKDAAMPGPRPALCTFPEDFLQEALDTVSRRTAAVQNVQRFRLVLLLHERPSLGNDEAAAAVGLSTRQVQRWRSRWADGDFSVEDHPGRGRKAAFSPS